MRPEDVAEAVAFMVTRPKGVAIRDLVIVPTALDL
jgi:ribitol 2-dehydrogenase